jgi:hypothetical protein
VFSASLIAILEIQVRDDQAKEDGWEKNRHEMKLGFPVHAALTSAGWRRFL